MIETSGFDKSVDMTVPMEEEQELLVAQRAGELALGLGFDKDTIDEMKLAIIEAVINAFEHSKSAQRIVFITFGLSVKKRRMTIFIRDYGSGFNPGAVEKPDIAKKMHKGAYKRGWGLKLMESLMDEVRIDSSPEGTQVMMVKHG
jgi:serine/threonine-protein kinase RsbW